MGLNRMIFRVAGFAADIFYRRSMLGGEIPAEGPVLMVGNHPNGLVDPVLLARATTRTVRFLGKAPLFDMPAIGSILRGAKALPVYRAIDGADTAQIIGLQHLQYPQVFLHQTCQTCLELHVLQSLHPYLLLPLRLHRS